MDKRSTQSVDRAVLSLEKKIDRFEERISKLHDEMLELKRQHTEMIALIKQRLIK